MRVTLHFLLRLIFSFILTVIVGAAIGFVVSFVGVLSVKIAGLPNEELYKQNFRSLGGALSVVSTIPIYIAVFRSQFLKKERFFAGLKAIAISFVAGLIILGFALFGLDGLLKKLDWFDPVKAIQVYFMFAIAVLGFWSGYLTLKFLPDSNILRQDKVAPGTVKLFKYTIYGLVLVVLVTPGVAYESFITIVAAFLSSFSPVEIEQSLQQPTLFMSPAFTAAAYLLVVIMIYNYRSNFARNLFVTFGIFGTILAPFFGILIGEIGASTLYIIMILVTFILVIVALVLILMPSARAWINQKNDDLSEIGV